MRSTPLTRAASRGRRTSISPLRRIATLRATTHSSCSILTGFESKSSAGRVSRRSPRGFGPSAQAGQLSGEAVSPLIPEAGGLERLAEVLSPLEAGDPALLQGPGVCLRIDELPLASAAANVPADGCDNDVPAVIELPKL